jgi:hypothetical protein
MITKKSQNTVPSPEAILYTQLTPSPTVLTDAQAADALRKNIVLETQGEPVEISEEYSTPILMIVFDVVHKTSPELVLRLKTGKRVLIFDHWGAPILRDEDIYEEFGTMTRHAQKDKTKTFFPELILNLENIWKETEAGGDDDLSAIKKALEKIENQIKPAMVTTLVGKAPALLFLLTQHLLHGKTGEIWYQESLSSKPVKITSDL